MYESGATNYDGFDLGSQNVRPIWNSDGQISAAYVEQQYPDQKWVPPSNEALQAFLRHVAKAGQGREGWDYFLARLHSAFAQAAPS